MEMNGVLMNHSLWVLKHTGCQLIAKGCQHLLQKPLQDLSGSRKHPDGMNLKPALS